MKCTIIERPTNTLPAVGQAWKAIGHDPIYMRINDRDGVLAATDSENCTKEYFYSVNLSNGCIYRYSKLRPIELLAPMGGTMAFERLS